MRIAIVNDMKLAVEALRRCVLAAPGASIAWIAEDGMRAVEACARDTPDLILMDMIMPVMDGVETTRRIMQSTPCPILVVTATVEGNSRYVYEALGAGALDAVATPVLGPDGAVANAGPLFKKIASIALLTGPRKPAPPAPDASTGSLTPARATGPLLVIGASTGGPQALAVVLRGIKPTMPWPAVIVQHIDQSFARGLAEWLSSETGHRVRPAEPEEPPLPGVVYLAAKEDHLVLGGGRLRYTTEPADAIHRPSIDVLCDSLVSAGAAPGIAVLLTGMGRDGAAGLLKLHKAGWETIAQDKDSSVVWGMPGAAIAEGGVSRVLPVVAIGPAIASCISARTAANPGGGA